ncbi:MAG: DUF5615 family PIN-like protein [Acaryochloris sp. RU_4_1]|nr:DUF5615 family PIN-like protein [Acaryochloris sp. RU_4_1]
MVVKLYADEQFPLPVVKYLRQLSYDVLTVQESGQSGSTDPAVLDYAIRHDRVLLTQNRRDFVRLHRLQPNHRGIIVCSEDRDFQRLANQIHCAISSETKLHNKLLRIVRPSQ